MPDVIPLGTSDDPDAADARMGIELWRGDAPSPRLVITAHGRNGAARAPHMLKLIDAYRQRDYVVLSPDCCASAWNDSAGTEADFLLENHVRDVRRTADWAVANAGEIGWSGGHLALSGHSMGAYAAARLATGDYAGRISHLLLVSPFTSGVRQIEAREKYHPDGIANLRRDVPRALDEWPRHDIFTVIDQLTLPIAVFAGGLDIVAPPENVREFVDRLPVPPHYRLLPEASHCLEGSDYQAELLNAIDWLDAAGSPSASA
ncbi:MAG: acetoin dehydrogenase subunit dihydrolipoyllysine-residue acetyltransferase [Proteobacteria bacterium]|nr:acetoin dehydrogenase subunit dihydrolipoyllysine-residue acetyltransferase [Pseudomonadota bacterium]